MRTFCVFLLMTPLLAGCTESEETVIVESKIELDYGDFSDIVLEWKNLFFPAKSQYFVYIYSVSCGHCSHIKKEVLEHISIDRESFYLTEFSSDIPLCQNTWETIGKSVLDEVAILGTPTLIGINNGYVSLNIAGEKDIITYLDNLPHKEVNCNFDVSIDIENPKYV